MNKKLLLFVSLFLTSTFAFSGGLVTNTNQSTAWTRMLIRDASTSIDAVFFNPAGLSKLSDGFHFSINNQSLFQTQNITSTFPYLNSQDYEGTVKAPVFPGVYGVYKKGKMALSFGFNPVGGGGGATFDKGLPSMEIPFSGMVPVFGSQMAPLGASISGYSMDMFFEGTSVYFGLQLGLTYEVNDWLSLFAGGRYVMAKNTYNGYIKDVKFITGDAGSIAPGAYVGGYAAAASANAALATGGGDGLTPIIAGGGGAYTFAQLEGAGFISAAQRAQLEGGLLAMGVPQSSIDAMSAAVAQGTYYGIAAQLNGAAAELGGYAALLNIVTADQDADVIQTGNAITPIVGANLSFMNDKLNIGIKYEFLTKMDLIDDVANVGGKELGFINGVDLATGQPTYMFKDGNVTNADIPAFLSIGAAYQATDKFNVSVGFHTYFDEAAGWATDDNGNATVDGNFLEYGLGLEYLLTDRFLVSAGYLGTKTSATEFYNDDLSYSLNTTTVGGGGAFKLNDKFTLQFGAFYTMYQDDTFDKSYVLMDGVTSVPYTETYAKATWAFSLGIDISLGGKKKAE